MILNSVYSVGQLLCERTLPPFQFRWFTGNLLRTGLLHPNRLSKKSVGLRD